MSYPLRGELSDCGRSAYRWSYGSDVPGSATPIAELYKGIAIVGVLPPFVLGGCNDCKLGSTLVTKPGQAPNDWPEPLLMIRLPAPAVGPVPLTKHSFAPLLAMMVSWSVRR